ncbi:MAG: hypothetical protein RL684_261 [Pseudomonadota bacterium]|jgi:hypothetical protein|nr:hypothetical protein [Rhodanobacteraceae bacterium]
MRLFMPILLGLVLLAGCARPPDEASIRGAIEAIARAAEAHDGKGMLEHITDDFIGNDGEFDRQQLENFLRLRLVAARGVTARAGRIDLELSGDRATARFEARVADASGRWIPGHGAVVQFVTGWRRERGVWRCNSAKWSARPPGGRGPG